MLLKEVCPHHNQRRPGRELTATLRNLRYPTRGNLQPMNSLVHPPLSAQTRVCLGGHQRWLQGVATVRPVRQTTCGLEMVFNSLAPGLHSPRTASPGLSQLSCVLRVAAPQSCQVPTKRGCVLTDSWRHLLGNAQRWSTGSLPHQLRKPLYGSPGLLRKKVCSRDNKWPPGKQQEVRCLLLHRTNR